MHQNEYPALGGQWIIHIHFENDSYVCVSVIIIDMLSCNLLHMLHYEFCSSVHPSAIPYHERLQTQKLKSEDQKPKSV